MSDKRIPSPMDPANPLLEVAKRLSDKASIRHKYCPDEDGRCQQSDEANCPAFSSEKLQSDTPRTDALRHEIFDGSDFSAQDIEELLKAHGQLERELAAIRKQLTLASADTVIEIDEHGKVHAPQSASAAMAKALLRAHSEKEYGRIIKAEDYFEQIEAAQAIVAADNRRKE